MQAIRIFLASLFLFALLGVGSGWLWGEESEGGQEIEDTEADYDNLDYEYDENDNEDEEEETDHDDGGEFEDYNEIYYDEEDVEIGNDEL